MDNKDKTPSEFEVEIEADQAVDNKLSVQEQIYEIEIKMQEIDVQIEHYEDSLYNSDEEIYSSEKLVELTEEYKKLRREKKLLTKELKGKWDQIPMWMFIYGIFQIIFSLFVVIIPISMYFTGWFLSVIGKDSKFWVTFTFLIIPILSVLISALLLILQKIKTRKMFMIVLLAIQVVETTISLLIMFT